MLQHLHDASRCYEIARSWGEDMTAEEAFCLDVEDEKRRSKTKSLDRLPIFMVEGPLCADKK